LIQLHGCVESDLGAQGLIDCHHDLDHDLLINMQGTANKHGGKQRDRETFKESDGKIRIGSSK